MRFEFVEIEMLDIAERPVLVRDLSDSVLSQLI